ncbi:MAG: YkgJ family cysteine cluster protein [Salibacteraceae bacterium]
MNSPNQHSARASSRKKAHKKLVQNLKRRPQKVVDALFQECHEEVFEKTDCLKCANCCITTGPRFSDNDISRIAKYLRMKPGAFVERYLRIDEDEDYVLQQVPCTFLEEDNRCSIYDVRPKACREYPHTDRAKQQQLFPLLTYNRVICPAVFEILEQIEQRVSRS